jgi:uncharacterized DUF497 family protein
LTSSIEAYILKVYILKGLNVDILSRVEGFDWDKGNIEKNWERHKVSFIECEEVFFNEPLIVQADEVHSITENRYYALGRTNDERYLFIASTIRANKIRVISARDMSKRERRIYGEEIEKASKIQK